MLPPTRAALLPYITCANYITMRDKWYVTNQPALLPIDQNGLCMEDNVNMRVCCLTLPAPRAVIELTNVAAKLNAKEGVVSLGIDFLAHVHANVSRETVANNTVGSDDWDF